MQTYTPEYILKKRKLSKVLNIVLGVLWGAALISAAYSMYIMCNHPNQSIDDASKVLLNKLMVFEGVMIVLGLPFMVITSNLLGYKEIYESQYAEIWERVLLINNPEITILVKDVFKRQGNKLVANNYHAFYKIEKVRKYYGTENMMDFLKKKFM